MATNFEREDLQAPLSEINMTPLVDVMLVLLVIFLVTAPMLNSAIKLNLPKEGGSQITEEKPLVISVDKQGQYYLNNNIISFAELENLLKINAANHPEQQIHLRADIDVSYGKVSQILALAQRLGLHNIAFVTQER